MGKSQKKRAKRRHNPMRVPDSHLPHGVDSASLSSKKRGDILPILRKIECVDAAERRWACAAVSNLIQNDPSTRRLLQGKNIVGALITRLTDSECEVVVEAAGTLRNLCIDGGYDICAEMYNKNILSPLKSYIPKISTALSHHLKGSPSTPENARKLIYEFSESLITILWCLSEISNKALSAINAIQLVPFLMSFISARDTLPIAPVTAAAQSLYVLSDDNPPVISDLRGNPGFLSCLADVVKQKPIETLLKSTDPRLLLVRVLAAGILLNLSPLPQILPSIDVDEDIVRALILPIVSSACLSECVNFVQELITLEEKEPNVEILFPKNALKSDHKSATEKNLEKIEIKLRTIQLALEISTGACASLPGPEPDLDTSLTKATHVDQDRDENFLYDAKNEDVEMQEVQDMTPSFLFSLVVPLLALVYPTPLSFPPAAAPSIHPPTTSALISIHISALECINNIFLSLSTSPFQFTTEDVAGGQRVWDEIWSALAAVGTQPGLGQEGRQRIWDTAVGVLWGVGNVWKRSVRATLEQVELLKKFCNLTPDATICVRCIGTLETVAQYPESLQLNKVIAEYLLSLLHSSGTPRVGIESLIQAVSGLIDIYSEEEMPYDVNFRQGGYLENLVASVNVVEKMVRNIDRVKERDIRSRAEEVRDNLIAFIEYRKDLAQ